MKINKNIFWSEFFVSQLSALGIEQVCISPGSRSTPLTIAFAENNNFQKFVHIDERSSAFFALGLAKSDRKPVAVVTTSGTAVAELYPAIVEAYQHRIPLIICTADRPAALRNTGANQTINQTNIFSNHIRYSFDIELPGLFAEKFILLKSVTTEAVKTAMEINPGPVHLNFQFDKPFEPDSFTDDIDTSALLLTDSKSRIDLTRRSCADNFSLNLLQSICNFEKGVIFCGPNNFSFDEKHAIVKISEHLNFPLFADGASGLRFGFNSANLISNYNALLKSNQFVNSISPDLIIQFGAASTSNSMLDFFKNCNAKKILVNENGDLHDPSKTTGTIISCKIENFAETLLSAPINNTIEYLKKFIAADLMAEKIKLRFISDCSEVFEGKVISEIISKIPDPSNLFIANSMPVRDLDLFTSASDKQINIYENRGASGIDGIVSTALGVACNSEQPTFLIIGDLSFNYDLTALQTAVKYNIPLKIFLINNNGGGIFKMLPVYGQENYFEEYFNTAVNVDFEKIISAFGVEYKKIDSLQTLPGIIDNLIMTTEPAVCEISTNSNKSAELRKKYIQKIVELFDAAPD